MMNTNARSSWIIAGWIATLAITAAASMAMDANGSTTALLIALGVAPGVVVALVKAGAPAPSVAQLLYAVETKEGRS